MYFSQFWRLGSPRSRCPLIQFLVRALFLAYTQLPSPCVLTWWRERDIWYIFFFYKDTSSVRSGLHPLTSFNLSHPLKGPISSTVTWGLVLQHRHFGKDTNQPTALILGRVKPFHVSKPWFKKQIIHGPRRSKKLHNFDFLFWGRRHSYIKG